MASPFVLINDGDRRVPLQSIVPLADTRKVDPTAEVRA